MLPYDPRLLEILSFLTRRQAWLSPREISKEFRPRGEAGPPRPVPPRGEFPPRRGQLRLLPLSPRERPGPPGRPRPRLGPEGPRDPRHPPLRLLLQRRGRPRGQRPLRRPGVLDPGGCNGSVRAVLGHRQSPAPRRPRRALLLEEHALLLLSLPPPRHRGRQRPPPGRGGQPPFRGAGPPPRPLALRGPGREGRRPLPPRDPPADGAPLDALLLPPRVGRDPGEGGGPDPRLREGVPLQDPGPSRGRPPPPPGAMALPARGLRRGLPAAAHLLRLDAAQELPLRECEAPHALRGQDGHVRRARLGARDLHVPEAGAARLGPLPALLLPPERPAASGVFGGPGVPH